MSCELEKYKVLMEKYHRGDLGKENLTMSEILDKVGEPNLLDRMSVSDLQYLTLLGKKSPTSTQSVGDGMNC